MAEDPRCDFCERRFIRIVNGVAQCAQHLQSTYGTSDPRTQPTVAYEKHSDYRHAPVDCPSDHESGMAYDPETDGAICPLCGTRKSIEMGSL